MAQKQYIDIFEDKKEQQELLATSSDEDGDTLVSFDGCSFLSDDSIIESVEWTIEQPKSLDELQLIQKDIEEAQDRIEQLMVQQGLTDVARFLQSIEQEFAN